MSASTEVAAAPVVIGVYYDFASCLCYAAHRVMAQIEPELRERDVELRWLPLDLTLLTGWRRGQALPRGASIQSQAAALGVQLEVPPRWGDSRLAALACLQLQERGRADDERRLRDAIWNAVYVDGAELDTTLVERHCATLGLRAPVLSQESLPQESLPQESLPHELLPPTSLHEQTRDAAQLGVHGVPTFLLGIWPVGGIQAPATMLDMLGRYAARQRSPERGPEADQLPS